MFFSKHFSNGKANYLFPNINSNMSSNYHIKFSDFLKFIQSLPHRKINSKQNTVATKTSNDYITQNTAIILYYKTDFFPFYLNLLRYASNQNNLYQKYEKKLFTVILSQMNAPVVIKILILFQIYTQIIDFIFSRWRISWP